MKYYFMKPSFKPPPDFFTVNLMTKFFLKIALAKLIAQATENLIQ